MHISYMRKVIFILFLNFFFSCILETNFFERLNEYYNQGNFHKIMELIQKEELNDETFKNNIELYLWKGRIYSLNSETYGIAQSYYELYIQKKTNPEIYLEYTLFLMDIKDYNRIKNLISGENIPPEIIFHPYISDIRNFLECINKVGNLNFINVIKKTTFIQHSFFYNYCIILNINFVIEKKIFYEDKTIKDLDLSSIDKINSKLEDIDKILSQLKIHEKNKKEYLVAVKNLLEAYLEKNERDYRVGDYYYLCSLQRHFPLILILPLNLSSCKKMYPNNLTLYRQIMNSQILENRIEPYFQNDIYRP